MHHVRDFEIVQTKSRFSKTKNCLNKKELFDKLTFRKPSQFEGVKEKMIIQNQEILNLNIARVLQRADPVSWRRGQPRRSERAKDNRDNQGDQND